MTKRSWEQVMHAIPVALAAFAGFALAWWRFGPEVLVPTSIAWVRGDVAWHFLSWVFFQHEPWHAVPGRIEGYFAPIGTSIGANDGLPLLAFPFKLLRAWLPDDVQYFGLWLFICYTLQGIFGYLLLRLFCPQRFLALLGALLLLLSPIFLFRVGHIALASHWLLLFAFWHYGRSAGQPQARPRAYGAIWTLIIGLAGLVHVYLAAMVVAFFLLSLIDEVRFKARMTEIQGLRLAVLALTLLGLEWGLSGLFGLGSGGGFRLYTLHPAALFNPLTYSRLLPPWPIGPGQYEGFAYLGLGFLALGGVALASLVRRAHLRTQAVTWLASPAHLPLLLLGAGFILFALGNKTLVVLEVAALYLLLAWFFIRHPPKTLQRIGYGPQALLLGVFLLLLGLALWAMPPQLTSAFRAPGRFVWPVVYGLELLGIVVVCRQFGTRAAASLLLGALALQLIDLKIDQRFSTGQLTFREHLQSDAWAEVVGPYDTLALVPPFHRSLAADDDYLDFAYLAATAGKRVTTGIVARAPKTLPQTAQALLTEALSGPRDPDTLYIFSTERFEQRFREEMRAGLGCTELDAYTLCSLRPLPENL